MKKVWKCESGGIEKVRIMPNISPREQCHPIALVGVITNKERVYVNYYLNL